MKLGTKIQLFSSFFMLVLILLINTAIYYLFYNISADSELNELQAETNTIVETMKANPEIAESQLLRAYLPADGMIRVIRKNGDKVVTITKQNEYTTLPIKYETKEMKEVISHAGVNVAAVSKPIIWNDGEIVTLQISKHLVTLQETMRTLFYVLVVASILMLIPTVIAGNLLSRFLLNPIKALIQTMKDNIRKEDWKKIRLKNHSRDELYQMEKTFNDMIDHLQASFQKQEQFVSDASHELKTPISIVKSYAQLLERHGKIRPEVFEEAVHAIDSEAIRMQKLVEQMLFLAKNKELNLGEKVDLFQLASEAKNTFAGVRYREIRLKKSTDKIFVDGNKDQLKQVVYILIDNALKYSDEAIQLDVSRRGKDAILSVTDLGEGIPEKEQNRIFDRFYRVDKARSRDTGGTGLGLSIARAIVKAHHGELSVDSKLKEGSTFTCKLPEART